MTLYHSTRTNEEGQHPVRRGYARQLKEVQKLLDNVVKDGLAQWKVVKEQLNDIKACLQRDQLTDAVRNAFVQVNTLCDQMDTVIDVGEREEWEIQAILRVIDLRDALRELQAAISRVPVEKLNEAVPNWTDVVYALDAASLGAIRDVQALAKRVGWWNKAEQAIHSHLEKCLVAAASVKQIPSEHPHLPFLQKELPLALEEAFRDEQKYIDPTAVIESCDCGRYGVGYCLRGDVKRPYKTVEEAKFTLEEPRILIVEDQLDVWQQPIEDALRAWQTYPVEFAATYEEALEKARTLQPNIAVLDMQIPRLADGRCHWDVGIDLLKQLREELQKLHVVVFTSYESIDALREQVQALGVNIHDYISKETPLEWLAQSVYRLQRTLEQGSAIIPHKDLPRIHSLEIDCRSEPPYLIIDQAYRVKLSAMLCRLLRVMAGYQPWCSIAREEIIRGVWPDAQHPGEKENALTSLVDDTRERITNETRRAILGENIILMSKGRYQLHGVARIVE